MADKTVTPSPSYTALVCPSCKEQLTCNEWQYSCSFCGRFYPIVGDQIIALFEEPKRAIAQAYLGLSTVVKQLCSHSDGWARKLESSQREQTLAPVLTALKDNSRFFATCASQLENHVEPAILLDVKADRLSDDYGYDFHYLEFDWTNEPTSCLQIEKRLKDIKQLMPMADRLGTACILGMGLGRVGLELASYYTDVWGVDRAYGHIAQYRSLLKGDIDFWRIDTKNCAHHSHLAEQLVASIPDCLRQQAESVKYVWADAFNTPFRHRFFDWVLSIYFSDVKPLPELVKETKRILKPGGYFLHYGPLQYHFSNIEYHYAYDEFRDYFVANGFEVVSESTSLPLHAVTSPTSLHVTRQYVDKVLLLQLVNSED